MGLCSVTILLGTALLLLAPGSTQVSPASTCPPAAPLIRGHTCDPCPPRNPFVSPQALSSSWWKNRALEQDLTEEM